MSHENIRLTGEKIKFARFLSGKNASELCLLLGFSDQSRISYLENCKEDWRIEKVRKQYFSAIEKELIISDEIYNSYNSGEIPQVDIRMVPLNGNKIRLARVLKGWTAKQLMIEAEISNKSTVSKIEKSTTEEEISKKHTPNIRKALKDELKLVHEMLEKHNLFS